MSWSFVLFDPCTAFNIKIERENSASLKTVKVSLDLHVSVSAVGWSWVEVAVSKTCGSQSVVPDQWHPHYLAAGEKCPFPDSKLETPRWLQRPLSVPSHVARAWGTWQTWAHLLFIALNLALNFSIVPSRVTVYLVLLTREGTSLVSRDLFYLGTHVVFRVGLYVCWFVFSLK